MAITKQRGEPKFSARSDPGFLSQGGEYGKFRVNRILGLAMLLFAIGFNLWIYRTEPTAKVDPNDNTFQFALVDRTNQIFDIALKKYSPSLLFDHWVPNWAQGYNLPSYYSHIPQILIVALWRLTRLGTLFQFYHWIMYLVLSFFPLSVFLSLRLTGLSWLSSGFGALIASQISTDGLYGLDPASYVWRGYGLSSQLFAAIFLPLAIAFSWKGRVLPAILTLAATTAGHLGIGIIAFMSVVITSFRQWKKVPIMFGGVFLLLGYWILPILTGGNYHNISVWDGIWKFDSFGYREVLKNLFNGDLFDFGRLPILTALIFIGVFSALGARYSSFSILFIFWILLYFGRTTWGGFIDLIPGMSEFHLSRFIVGAHIAGLFLIPIGMEWIFSKTKLVLSVVLVLLVLYGISPQTLRYATHNEFLIRRANDNEAKEKKDIDALLSVVRRKLTEKPGRVYPGRGGSWGKNFRIAETPLYMYLSAYGIPTILWLPETWSPNSDTEQYFSESNPAHYILYNVRYVVTPVDLPKENIQPFWKLLESGKTWRLYAVETDGYITTGVRPAVVSASKTDYRSLIRLWMHADYPEQGLYPELTFDKDYPRNSGLPNFRMLDEVTYKVPAGTTHNLFSEVPHYISPLSNLSTLSNLRITSQKQESDMVFSATVSVPENCTDCLVILRQTFHPSWRATIDGKPAKTLIVFPFYTAVQISEGTHDVVFSYEPSFLKKFLLGISLISLITLISLSFRTRLPARLAD